jgi:hypothetical protein
MSDYFMLNALTPEKGGQWTGIDGHWIDETTKAAIQALMDEELIRRNTKTTMYTMYKLTTAGYARIENFTREEKLLEVGSGGNSEASRALWAWLLLNGGHPEYYGGFKRGTAKFLHLCACGLDLDKSSPIESESWSSFEGTFAESGTDSGIGGRASCRCGAVEHYQIATKSFTIAQILEGVLEL